jgi:hypothetical protein
MPSVSYLVRSQVTARLATQASGFNYWLAQACENYASRPVPYAITWTQPTTNFWNSYVSSEDLDKSSTPGDGTICLIYGVRFENMVGTVQKFTVFSGVVEIGVEFDIAWDSDEIPKDTESLADATDDAMIQTFNSSAYFGSFGGGVLWNGNIEVAARGQLRESGTGWRQRIPYRLTFEVEA